MTKSDVSRQLEIIKRGAVQIVSEEELKAKLEKNILKDLKENISSIKRFISFEFGELDMSPKIKKKYGYDPTNV